MPMTKIFLVAKIQNEIKKLNEKSTFDDRKNLSQMFLEMVRKLNSKSKDNADNNEENKILLQNSKELKQELIKSY